MNSLSNFLKTQTSKFLALAIFDLIFVIGIWFLSSKVKSSVVGGVLVDGSKSIFLQLTFLLQIPLIVLFVWVTRKTQRYPKSWNVFLQTLNGKEIPRCVPTEGISMILNILVSLSLIRLTWLSIFRLANYGFKISLHILELDLFFLLILLILQKFGKKVRIFALLLTVAATTFISGYFFINPYSHKAALSLLIIGLSLTLAITVLLLFRSDPESRLTITCTAIISLWIFLLNSRIFGLVNLHSFESASYSNAQMMLRGMLPFRDFQLEHGLWQDALINFFGAKVAGNSYYDMQLGYSSIIHPLELILFLVPIYLLTRRIYLVLSLVLFIDLAPQLFGLGLQVWQSNLVLLPLSILVIRQLLRTQSNGSFTIFTGGFLALGLLLNYEFIYFLLGFAVELTAYIYLNKISLRTGLKQATLLLIGFLAALLLILEPIGIVTAYWKSFLTTSSGFYFAWGATFYPNLGMSYVVLNLFVPVTLLLFVFYRAFFFRFSPNSDLPLGILGPVFLGLGLYLKYLQWPDWHIGYPFVVILIVSVIFFPNSGRLRDSLHERKWRVGLVAIGFIALVSAVSMPLVQASQSISSVVGPANQTTNSYVSRVQEVDRTFSNYMHGSRQVFDFGNEPVTWYGINRFKSIGISKVLNFPSVASQVKIIEALKANPTVNIIWGGEFGYWSWPFGGNWISKYRVSEYILKNYSAVAVDGKYVLLAPNSTRPILNLEATKIQYGQDCNYGLSPSRFVFEDKDANSQTPQNPLTNGGVVSGDILHHSRLVVSVTSDGWVTFRNSEGNRINFFAKANTLNRVYTGGCPALYQQGFADKWTLLSNTSIKYISF